MTEQRQSDDLEDMVAETDAIEAAIQLAVLDALREHKRAGNPVASWENGQVVWIPADQLDVEALARQYAADSDHTPDE